MYIVKINLFYYEINNLKFNVKYIYLIVVNIATTFSHGHLRDYDMMTNNLIFPKNMIIYQCWPPQNILAMF